MAALVFDLDGTLVDSVPDLHAAASRMLNDHGREPLSLGTIRGFVGNGVPKLVERIMTAADLQGTASHAELTACFSNHYNAAPADLTQLYPNVVSTLRKLADQGHRMAICTNKPEEPTASVLDAFGLREYFQYVIGGDSLSVRKPDPLPLTTAFDQLGEPHHLFVGDSEVDAETAARAGVAFALFTEGYRKTPVQELPHTASFSDFSELPMIVHAQFAAKV